MSPPPPTQTWPGLLQGALQVPSSLQHAIPTSSCGLLTRVNNKKKDPPSLQSIRTTIDEQFSIEIILKHRELGDIEKEIAKTQVALEQLRRCSLVPYADSTEAQLHAQLNYTPPAANPDNIPDFAPPPEGVVDGPYTRHYRQWLISHQRFDGLGAPAYLTPPPLTPGVAMNGMHQSLSGSGRPQRQSAMKVQTKNGEQVCLFRRRDGVLVRYIASMCLWMAGCVD